jgi:hypothetical protein
MALKRQIPEEYMDYDYGFTGVSEEEYRKKETLADQKVSEIEATTSQKLRDASLQVNRVEAAKDKMEAAYKDKLYEVEKLVMPLLVNLLKTSDKEYIYWPDRKTQVEGQIDKLLGFTRGK